jgi:hypothetical protein
MNLSERLKASWFACSLLFLDAFSLIYFFFLPTLRLEMCFMFVARRFYNASFFFLEVDFKTFSVQFESWFIRQLGVIAARKSRQTTRRDPPNML